MLPGFNTGFQFSSASYSPEAQAYFDAMTTQPSDARKGLINTLIVGLQADGVWPKLDWLCLLAAHAEQAGRLNAKNPAKALTAFNSPTFTVDLGFTGNGTTSYLDISEAPNASGNSYSQNAAHLSVWKNSTNTGSLSEIGSPTSWARIRPTWGGTSGTCTINTSTSLPAMAMTSIAKGSVILSRTDGNNANYFINGAGKAGSSSNIADTVPSSIYVLRNANAYSSSRLACMSTGGALTDTDVGNLYSRLNTYLTAIGAN